MIRGALFLAICAATPAFAVTLSLPGSAVETVRREEGVTSIDLPNGAWNGAVVPTRSVDGRITRTAWQLRGQLSTPDQIATALTGQLTDDGWTIDFSCADESCGGYDFRFASNTLPAPDMYVDLGNFRYLLASGPDDAALSLMISRGRDTAWVQLTEVSPDDGTGSVIVNSTRSKPISAEPIADTLRTTGRVVLRDLSFASGSSRLEDGGADSLQHVATYLAANPQRTFAIVGHTDSDGGLEANIALSRARAGEVRRVLIDRFDLPPQQLDARGVGYLAPLGDNDTAEGRLANRRVEIVATN